MHDSSSHFQDVACSCFFSMGVEASTLAFRPPTPSTYSLLPAAAGGALLRFSDGWTPQLGLRSPRCPIRINVPPSPEAQAGLTYSCSLLTTGAPALHVRHPAGARRLTLLYAHGTSFDLGIMRDHIAALAAATNTNVLAYDYRGYGAARADKPSERAANEDADAALSSLLAGGVPIESVVLYGLSLGTAPTMHLAAGTGAGAAGVVIRSGFLSALAVVMGRPGSSLPGSPFNNAAAARHVHAPVLVIHGHEDELIGLWQAERLVQLCRRAVPPLLLEQRGHFDVESSPHFLPRLQRFLDHELRTDAACESPRK